MAKKSVTVNEDVYEELVKVMGELTTNQGKVVSLNDTIRYLLKLKGEQNAKP